MSADQAAHSSLVAARPSGRCGCTLTKARRCRQFFGADATATFDECWRPVLALVHQELDTQLHAYFDVIGVLIMTRIVSHCQLLMAHAQVRTASVPLCHASAPASMFRPGA